MKNYDETISTVFKRIDEYKTAQIRKRKTITRIAIPAFSVCLAVAIGVFAFAISGIRMAANKGFDLFGAFVVGFATAIGGGTIRDLLLGVTPVWMTNSLYVTMTILALLFVVVLLMKRNDTTDSIGNV
jgi:uncharacterized membrane protein YeiH